MTWHPSVNREALVTSAGRILDAIGEDAEREGLRDTPARFARSWEELTRGYRDDPHEWWRTFGAEGYDQMVCQWDIPVFSQCEHHLLPFIGYAHVGYIPKELVCGLSKFGRIVNMFARRLQIQERLTREIVDWLHERLEPRGVMVIIEAEHLCMTIRGVQSPGTLTTTSAVTGDFLDPAEGSRDEFLRLMEARRR